MSTRDTVATMRHIHVASSSRARSSASSAPSSGVATLLRHRAGDRHQKAEGHLDGCYLKGSAGDAANPVLTAVGYNFRRILAWLRNLLRLILIVLWRAFATPIALNPAC